MNDAARDLADATALIADEARRLDDRDYPAWLALFTDDCRYWVPVSPLQASPADGVAHFHDDKQLLMARTHRLLNPRAFGAEPPPRTCHIVSGVRIESTDAGEVVATSAQIMLEYRNRDGFDADQRSFGGRVTHRLRRTAEGMRIAEKRIDLINAEGPFAAMAAPL